MDRIISLLAAFVGLIALGGAILVHTRGQTEDQQMATQIAALQASLQAAQQAGTIATPPPSSQAPETGTSNALLALQDRIAALEQTTKSQASELAEAKAELAGRPAASEAPVQVATATPSTGTPAAVVADGPTSDCIPIGTRFMAGAGDELPICKTKVVVKVVTVGDGEVVVDGLGTLLPNTPPLPLDAKGCSIMVFSADTSGYAELRVNCA